MKHFLAQVVEKPSQVGIPTLKADQSTLQSILNIVFVIVGALSVMMIVIGGISYITSQGDPDKIKRAKQTIIYAIAGLIVVILAASIVAFVTGRLF